MDTIFVNEADHKQTWYIVDAAGKPLGRVAAKVASVLRGKHTVTYAPHQNMDYHVVVVNADKVVVSGGKEKKKMYYKHTGFVGHLKQNSFETLLARHPEQPLALAIKGMLPHNRLGRVLFGNVKVYAGASHPHVAQNPQPLEV
ncbi:MAG: 50S ribosomal protein L13 [Treponema sp.]|nr:50S ribosomal protein L13 [Treponema sp.]